METTVKYGCHVDLDEDMKPDECVITTNKHSLWIYAKIGMKKEECQHWLPVEESDKLNLVKASTSLKPDDVITRSEIMDRANWMTNEAVFLQAFNEYKLLCHLNRIANRLESLEANQKDK